MTFGPTSDPEPENEPENVETPAPVSPVSANVSPTPTGGAVVVDSGTTAERYIAAELQKARASLRISQISSVLLVLILGGYVSYLTTHFRNQLEPHAAAEIADGLIMQQVNDNGPELTSQIKQRIPEFIEKTPDYALEQMPKYRETLADRVENDLNKYCQSTSDSLGRQLDTFLDDHKDQIKGMLTSGNDPAQVKQVGDGLKQTLIAYIKDKPAGGESVGEQIDKSLTQLEEVKKRVHRLATAKDLTTQEQKARHAIAVLTNGIDAHKELQLLH
jgi:hypothetical protein